MKKILMVCECLGGGVYTYLTQLCGGLSGRYQITLVCSPRPEAPSDWREQMDPRVRLIELDTLGRLSRAPGVIFELRRLARELQPDVIHLHSSIAGGLGRLAFWGRRSLVYTPHGYAFLLLGPSWKNALFLAAERLLGRSGGVTLALCESEEEVARTLSKRVCCIETGLDLAELDAIRPAAARDGRFTVATLGRACPQKRPELFDQIARLVPEARFVWIGGGREERLLTAPNVEVTGWLPRCEALALAASADAFLLCSRGEGLPISLLECMYMGKLCLVSDVVGSRSVIRDGVNGCVCGSAEGYARRLRGAAERFPAELAAQARRDVEERYNMERMLEQYAELYDRLADGVPPW